MKDYEIKVGALNIPIVHKPLDDIQDVFDESDSVVLGCYMGTLPHPEIWLWRKLRGIRYKEILMHELTEAFNSQYELELSHIQIGVLGTVSAQVLSDNPKLKMLIGNK